VQSECRTSAFFPEKLASFSGKKRVYFSAKFSLGVMRYQLQSRSQPRSQWLVSFVRVPNLAVGFCSVTPILQLIFVCVTFHIFALFHDTEPLAIFHQSPILSLSPDHWQTSWTSLRSDASEYQKHKNSYETIWAEHGSNGSGPVAVFTSKMLGDQSQDRWLYSPSKGLVISHGTSIHTPMS
jgi:hypothetical protein